MTISILWSFAILFLLCSGYQYLGYRSIKREWKNKVEEWYDTKSNRKSKIMVWGEKFDQTNHGLRVKRKLIRANMPLMASEFYAMMIVSGMIFAYMLSIFFNIIFPFNILIAVIMVEITRRSLFYIRRNKYYDRMNEQLPEICRILANSTRSGMTLTQAIDLAAKEIEEPSKEEFTRLASELRLGVDFNIAINDFEKRVRTRDYKLFIATIKIQKKAGGNIHAVLSEMGKTLDERRLLVQETKTMTSEQKYISYIIPVIPVFLLLIMNNIMEGFLEPLFTLVGLILLTVFILGIVVTFIIIKKITDVRV
ncbi:type II secretion system F family protein [Salipaludibacillus daqingensis]|uniref:type II secretion system F family protein n=1 Tax=Salipaludibacillus daqingensis TaxID=3041001 RepID=UPI0024736CB2|nr:type II secretion system F family protein [Salipaludibacillus daqingensis]